MKSVESSGNPAHDAIRRAIAAIPLGEVASYGDVARRAGFPGRARLVARVLAHTPASAALPWHRVVRADGHIAFAPGSRGFRDQIKRLAGEGIGCRNGRVDIARHRNSGSTLDQLLWGP